MELRPLPTGKPRSAVRGPADAQCPPRGGGRGEPSPRRGRTRPCERIPACHFPRQIARGDRRMGRAAGDCVNPAEPGLEPAISTGAVMTDHYDVIVIGSGAGGGTLTHALAPTGKRILLLERGDFLPRE